MNAIDLFLLDHARVHAAALTGNAGGLSLVELATRHLTDEQWRLRPHGLNSLAWLFWHLARIEDVAVNVMVAGRAQVFDAGSWGERLGVARRDIGTEMTASEVRDLSEAVNVAALRDYRNAVGLETRAVAATLPPEALTEVAPPARLGDVRAQGAFVPQAEWVLKIWEGKTKGWFLAWLGAGHSYMHLGHGRWVKKLILAGVTS